MDANGPEKADDKRAHHGKAEMAPEAAADSTVVEVRPHIKADHAPTERAENAAHHLARAMRRVKRVLVAGNEGQVQELDPPPEDRCHRIATGGIAEDQIRDLQEDAPIGLEQLHAATVCDEGFVGLDLGKQNDEEEEQERDSNGEKEEGRLA